MGAPGRNGVPTILNPQSRSPREMDNLGVKRGPLRFGFRAFPQG